MATESTTPTESEAAAPPHPEAAEGVQKPKEQRSWRRKYRKMRVKFDETMNASNTLIKEEYKAMAVAARLQEQNDQILEALLDLNETARLPANLRFDLRELADTEAEADPEVLQQRLHELRDDMIKGAITPEEFAHKADQIHRAPPIIPNRSLSRLEALVPHSTQVPSPPPEGLLLGDHAPGYMDSMHEDEYLLALDTALADPSVYDPDAHDGRPLRIPPSRPIPTEKELSIQNPDSVYNWLRKHKPQVFLQDKDHHPENVSEKSAARQGGGSGKSKRGASGVTPGPKNEPEGEDELGFIPETGTVTATAKGRRAARLDDDQAYRPKGGSSRGSKRKREDGDPVGKGGRKKRASNISAAGQ